MQALLVYVVCGLCWTVYNAFFSEMGAIQIARQREREGFATFMAIRVVWALVLAPFWLALVVVVVVNPGGIVEEAQDNFRREYLDDPERHRALHDVPAELPAEVAEVPMPPSVVVVCGSCGVSSEIPVDLEGAWEEELSDVHAELFRLGWCVDEEEGWLCPRHAKASLWTVLAWHWREFKYGLKERR